MKVPFVHIKEPIKLPFSKLWLHPAFDLTPQHKLLDVMF